MPQDEFEKHEVQRLPKLVGLFMFRQESDDLVLPFYDAAQYNEALIEIAASTRFAIIECAEAYPTLISTQDLITVTSMPFDIWQASQG